MAETLQYPAGLRTWTERALKRCASQVEARHVAERIQEKIASIEASGELWSTQWEDEALPPMPEDLGGSAYSKASLGSIGEVEDLLESAVLKLRPSKTAKPTTKTSAPVKRAGSAAKSRPATGRVVAGRGRGRGDSAPVNAKVPVTEAAFGAAFAKADKNRSGTLDRKELKDVLKLLGIDARLAKSEAILRQFDADHSGSLSLREFTSLCCKLAGLPGPLPPGPPPRPALSEAAIGKIFAKHDRNRTGFLSRKELQPALRDLHVDVSRKEAGEMLHDYDADESNTLSLQEFTSLCRRIGSMGEPFDRFDVEHCRRWAERRGLQPGGLGIDFAGDYATKGLYAHRGGKYDGIAFFGTGGGETVMDASPSHEQYRPHLEEAAALRKRRAGSVTELTASSARIISSASRADGRHAIVAKVGASLGRSIAGAPAADKKAGPEDRPVARTAAGAVVSAALARSIAKPLKSSEGEYKYDAALQAYQARALASIAPRGAPRAVKKPVSGGDRAEAGCQADLLLSPLPPLPDVRRAFIKYAPPPPGFPSDEAVRKTFGIFDRDGSGSLSRRELREAMGRMGMATDTLGASALLRAYDDDLSGALGLREFASLVHDMIRSTAADLGHTSLAYRNVKATLRELGLDAVGGDAAARAFRRYDEDGSRSLDLGEFVRLVEELAGIKARHDDEAGSARDDVAEVQALVERLGELKLELRHAGLRAAEPAAAPHGFGLDAERRRVAQREDELRRKQRELRSLMPRPRHGDSVLVCSVNEVGTVTSAGGDGRPYGVELPGGRAAQVDDDDLLLQNDAHADRRWEEVEMRTALVRERARILGERARARDDRSSGADSSRAAILSKMAPVRASLRAKSKALRESRDAPRDQGAQCGSMAIQPYGEVMPPPHLRPPPAYGLPSSAAAAPGSSASARATTAATPGDGPQEYKTEERVVLNGAARVVSYTDLTTGLAHWRMPKAAGKFKAGEAPTTVPNANWYKPGRAAGEGAWLGNHAAWPVGETTFSLRFEVETPGCASLELAYCVDDALKGATLNGKPLRVAKERSFRSLGGEMVLRAPRGAGLFQQGTNTLALVVHNQHKTPNPCGIYAKGRALVSERVELADGSSPHPLVVRTFERYDANGSGALSRKELRTVLRDLGLQLSPAGAADALRDFDVDGSGTLNLAEFAALTVRLGFVPPPEGAAPPHHAVVAAFRRFDANATGALSASELRSGLGALGLDLSRADATALLRDYDADRNGTLSLDEFATLARRLGFSPPPPAPQAHAGKTPRGRHHLAIVRKFEEFDVNRTGALSLRELRAMLGSLGVDLSRQQAVALLRDYDADGNGTLSLDEFAEIALQLGFGAEERVEPRLHPSVVRAFERVDANRSGAVTRDELRVGLRELGIDLSRGEALELLRGFDADFSGTLDLAEFGALALRLGFRPPASEGHPPVAAPAAPAASSPSKGRYSDTRYTTTSEQVRGFRYGVLGTGQPAWLWATLAEAADRKEELAEAKKAAPGGGDEKELEQKRGALRLAEQRLEERRAELRASMPRPRVGDTVVVCGAASAETGVVTEDEGRVGLTVRLESGKGRRYREEELLLHDTGGHLPSEQVARLREREATQRDDVTRAASRLSSLELSIQRRPEEPESARLRAELGEVTGWVGDFSRGVVAQVSAQARALELLAMDLASLGAATGVAPLSAAEREAGRHQLLGADRDAQRARRRADGAVGVLR